jgi:hypothetical protein
MSHYKQKVTKQAVTRMYVELIRNTDNKHNSLLIVFNKTKLILCCWVVLYEKNLQIESLVRDVWNIGKRNATNLLCS